MFNKSCALFLLSAVLLAGCDSKTASNQSSSSPNHNPEAKDPLSLQFLHTISSASFADAGMSPESIGMLLALQKLRDIERCVVKFKHWVYVETESAITPFNYLRADKIYEREGYILLLGCRDNKVIGLTTRCSVDFRKGLKYERDNGGINPKSPKFVAGVLALEIPGNPNARDFHLVKHETNKSHERFQNPDGWSRSRDEFLGKMKIKPDFWSALVESGDQVSVDLLGNNDLAFVTFDKDRQLGAGCFQAPNGLGIAQIWKDFPIARADLKIGDIITGFDGHPVRTIAELTAAASNSPFNKDVLISISRDGSAFDRNIQFHHLGNFMTQGKVGNLGLEQPEKILSALFSELGKMGGLLHRELLINCHWCQDREDQGPGQAPSELVDWIKDIAPFATGLVFSIIATPAAYYEGYFAMKWGIKSLEGIAIADGVYSEVQDLRVFLKTQFSLGQPFLINSSSIKILEGDLFEADDKTGARVTIQLAHIKTNDDESKTFLGAIVALATTSHCGILAIPDGRDHKGNLHCHVILLRPGKSAEKATDTVFPTSLDALGQLIADPSALASYVNLIMIIKGKAMAYNHNVGDGRSTRFLLDALRFLTKNRDSLPKMILEKIDK